MDSQIERGQRYFSLPFDSRIGFRFAAALAAVLLLGTGPAAGQSVYGRVLVLGDTIGVSGADLTLADSTGTLLARVQADSAGRFRIPAPGPGRFILGASRIGFAGVSSAITIGEREVVEAELRMAEEAIPLEPLLVVARREIDEQSLEMFYDRMARNRQRGVGHFLTLDQIENRTQLSLAILLQTLPGVWYRGGSVQMVNPSPSGGRFCTPEFFLDGMPMLGGFREIVVMDMEGVEVYRGYSEAQEGIFPSPCGQIFLWRKRDWGNPFSWRRVFLAAGLLAVGWTIIGSLGWGPG